MTATRSMVDVAYDIMSKKKRSIAFGKLWEDVSKTCQVDNNFIGQFYNDLTLDSRFVTLKDNKWDLKERRKYDESHVDLSKIDVSDDEDEEDEENKISEDY